MKNPLEVRNLRRVYSLQNLQFLFVLDCRSLLSLQQIADLAQKLKFFSRRSRSGRRGRSSGLGSRFGFFLFLMLGIEQTISFSCNAGTSRHNNFNEQKNGKCKEQKLHDGR